MRKALNLKHIRERSFMINGLTAKWGIGDARKPPFWETALIARYDVKEAIEVEGVVTSIPNTATVDVKPGSLTDFKNVVMENGSLVFNGVDAMATVAKFQYPAKFTVLWDIDWLGTTNTGNGLRIPNVLVAANKIETNQLEIWLGAPASTKRLPNTIVGVSTDGYAHNKDGSKTSTGLAVGTDRTPQNLYVAHNNGIGFTSLAFRSLYIFNRELTADEMAEALAAMFS